ncbi:aminopeptidase P family protein [Thermaerobacter litoralis]
MEGTGWGTAGPAGAGGGVEVPQLSRVRALQKRMEAAGVDLLVVTPGTSWSYLTGVHLLGSRLALLMVPRQGDPAAVAPLLEAERVAAAPLFRSVAAGAATDRVCPYADGEEPAPAVARAVALATAGMGGAVRVAAMEERVARLFEWRAAGAALPGVEWRPAEPLLGALRARKDAAEVAAIRKAAELVETALGHGTAFVQPGYRESQIAREIERALRELGTRSPFGIHVASGPRSAIPHAETEERVLQPGDLVWIDVGAEVDGYASDITRTFLLPGGDPAASAQKAAIYRVCYLAQAAAREAARPGVPAGAVDAAARRVIEAAGYGPYFTHRTGHGLGLDVHEAPNIAPGETTLLEPGMVFTVEPGIYLPGVGGVRIEDDLLITEDGAVSLTRYRRWLAPGAEPARSPEGAAGDPAGPRGIPGEGDR